MNGLSCYSQLSDYDMLAPEAVVSENLTVSLTKKDTGFFEILEYEFRRAARYKNSVTLVFIKLCNFEKIVREYGQITANTIMSEIENVIKANMRNTDRGFIYGKDEYMIILPNTSKTNASSLILKLQKLISTYRFSAAKGNILNLMPKFGVASYPNSEEQFTKSSIRQHATN
jgi:diguanylate cyclase (GGDEF)-like protein